MTATALVETFLCLHGCQTLLLTPSGTDGLLGHIPVELASPPLEVSHVAAASLAVVWDANTKTKRHR